MSPPVDRVPPAIRGLGKVHHVALIVASIENALELWRDLLGLELEMVKDIPGDRVRIAFLAVGESKVELVEPTDETMELISSVRLGVNLGLLEDVPIATVNELFLHTQPAHLQKLMGSSLDGEERNAARARYLRTRLREQG